MAQATDYTTDRTIDRTTGHIVGSHIQTRDGIVDLLALHRVNPQRYPYLLQSVAHGADAARYDILFAFPGDILRLDALSAIEPSESDDFLTQLDARWQAESLQPPKPDNIPPNFLPFNGGWFLFLAYELAGQVEPSLNLPTSDDGLPIAYAARIPAAVIVDHQQQQTYLVTETGHEELLHDLRTDLDQAQAPVSLSDISITLTEEEPARYLQGVERIKNYIVDGDVFQVNLSRAWQGQCADSVTPADIYQSLCAHNPAPFAGLAVMDDAAVISSSPERLVQVSGDQVGTRPIAGTRPRAVAAEDDVALQTELLAHPKERAEHIMLIDLERNDLGRVCVPGSVEVDELMVLESYTHVHHIVSNVRGRLHPGITPGQVIRAVFPGGTITGCPKVRCMEIIAELEGEGRGAYTGAMGYLNRDGSLDLNILIRTITLSNSQIRLRAGAGIVADSVAEKELEETRAKARGMLLAVAGNKHSA